MNNRRVVTRSSSLISAARHTRERGCFRISGTDASGGHSVPDADRKVARAGAVNLGSVHSSPVVEHKIDEGGSIAASKRFRRAVWRHQAVGFALWRDLMKPAVITAALAVFPMPLVSSIALAQSEGPSSAIGQQAGSGASVAGFRDPTDLPNEILQDSQDKESRAKPPLSEELIKRWDAFKGAVYDRTGIRYALAYAYVLQHAASDSDSVTGSGGQAELNFTWDVIGRDGTGQRGYFGGKIENRHTVLSDTDPQAVAPRAGSVWSGAPGYGKQDWSVPELWYEHQPIRGRLIVRAGKIIPFSVFDYYKYKSPRTGFLGQPQNVNPTIPYPPSALGSGGGAQLTNGVYGSAGIFDANGVATRAGFDTLFNKSELFTIADLGWAPDFVDGLKAGKDYTPNNDDVHLTIWHSDKRKAIGRSEGWGFTTSAQKGFGKIVPFIRYGYSHGGATPLKHMVNVGVGLDDVFDYAQDTIGVGFTFAKPSASGLRDQYAGELYYKMQITPRFAITPNVQVIGNPANNPDSDLLGLFSIRGRLAI